MWQHLQLLRHPCRPLLQQKPPQALFLVPATFRDQAHRVRATTPTPPLRACSAQALLVQATTRSLRRRAWARAQPEAQFLVPQLLVRAPRVQAVQALAHVQAGLASALVRLAEASSVQAAQVAPVVQHVQLAEDSSVQAAVAELPVPVADLLALAQVAVADVVADQVAELPEHSAAVAGVPSRASPSGRSVPSLRCARPHR
jgi:hypothetical protein